MLDAGMMANATVSSPKPGSSNTCAVSSGHVFSVGSSRACPSAPSTGSHR